MHKFRVQPGPKQNFYSIEAAAAYLTIGTTTLYTAIQQRQLKHARFGKSIRISHECLMDWVEEQSKPTLKMAAFYKKRGGNQTSIQPIIIKSGPPSWPPKTVNDYRKLAKHIEKKY